MEPMGNEVKISVVIPTYNSRRFIGRTLSTVYGQTCPPYEVIVMDDGSRDGTPQAAAEYASAHGGMAYTRIYRQRNKGAGAARNAGIRHATGNWIAFLDSDDLWHPRKLELVLDAIRLHPGASIIAHDEFNTQEGNLSKKTLSPMHLGYDASKDLFLQLYEGNLFSTSCMTVKKDLIQQAGGFDTSLRSAQDYDMWIRLGMHGALHYMENPLGMYVMREGNITSNTYRRYLCEMRICRKYIPQLKQREAARNIGRVVRKRIFRIHKSESYLSLRKGDVSVAAKILMKLPVELLRKI